MTLTDATMRNTDAARMWDAHALRENTEWQLDLTEAVVAEFAEALRHLPETPDEVRFSPAAFPAMMRLAGEIRRVLFEGHGVCLVKGLADTEFTPPQHRLFYAVLGMALGTPLKNYGLLYPIQDRGVDYTKTSLPVSMTCAETEFHTDSSSIDANPDILSLLCETPSLNGGESQVSNGLLIYHRLKEEAPEVLEILQQQFIRDIVTPGKDATLENLKKNCFPIYKPVDDDQEVEFRYMRYWIERGHQRAEQPLSSEEIQALDTLDRHLKDPRHMVSFFLKAGDMIYFNNKTVAHNRTAYEDTPGNTRLLWRMWIAA